MFSKITFLFVSISILTACSGNSGGANGNSNSTAQLIPLPNMQCGTSDCINTSLHTHFINPFAVGDGADYLQDEYANTVQIVSKIRSGLNTLNTIASNAGYTSCSGIPASGTITTSGITFEFRAPSLQIDFGFGLMTMEKKILLSTNGTAYMDIHINCGGSTTLKSVHIILAPTTGGEFEVVYQIDTATGLLYLQSAVIETVGNISTKSMSQFQTTSSTAFRFASISEYTDSSVMTNNVQYQRAVAQTDATNNNNLEYVTTYTNASMPNTLIDNISYGSSAGQERVCVINYKTSSPILSTTDSDCNSSGASALLPTETYPLTITSGSPWSFQYVHDLEIANLDDIN